MAARSYSLLLTKADFPFRADLHPRTALADEIPSPQSRFSQEIIPQLIYVENVMPCKQGYDSLDETVPIPNFSGAFTPKFDKIYAFHTETTQEKILLSPANGRCMVLRDGDTAWVSKLNLAGNPICSRAERFAINYFWFRGHGAYRYNAGTTNMDAITFTSLVVGNILGIVAASNYLIAFDSSTIYYTLNLQVGAAVDFTPVLGIAGSTQILALRGTLQVVLPYANGFIIYSDVNAVMASYTGNPNAPFSFREIPGSAGLKRDQEVAEDTNIGVHFAWTGSGLQQVTPDRALNIFPELNDFIKQRILESFDFSTGVVTRTTAPEALSVQVVVIAHRYLCISYGATATLIEDQTYSEALIYDLDLKRWGKLKVVHTTLFPFGFTGALSFLTWDDLAAVTWDTLAATPWQDLYEATASTRNLSIQLASLALAGAIKVFMRSNLNDSTGISQSKIILGRLAVLRNHISDFNELQVETSQLTNLDVYSSDNFDPYSHSRNVAGQLANFTGSTFAERWLFFMSAKFHNIALRGRFHLTTALAALDDAGEF